MTSGIIDVTAQPYSASGKNDQDDSGPINSAIQDAAAKGGIVWIPPGAYRLERSLKIPASGRVSLVGAGWAPGSEQGNFTNRGTWFVIAKNGDYVSSYGIRSALYISGQGSVVRDIAFFQEHDLPKPFVVDIAAVGLDSAGDCLIENVHVFNPSIGIWLSNVGRVTINRISGMPISRGILIRYAADVIKIFDTHFWTFWKEPLATKQVLDHACAIESFRCDNPHFSQVFALGYNRGFSFRYYDSSNSIECGPTSKFMIVTADLDYCVTPIEITGANTTGQIVNLNAQGGDYSICGISMLASGGRLQATNVRLKIFTTNAIRIGGACSAHLTNIWIQDWNKGQTSLKFPGIEATDDAFVQLGGPMFHEQSNDVALKSVAVGVSGNGRIITDAVFPPP